MAFQPPYNHLPAHIPPFKGIRHSYHHRFAVPRPDPSCSSDWYSSDSHDSDDEWYEDNYDHERPRFTTKTNFRPARGHTRWDARPIGGDFVNPRPGYYGDPMAHGPNQVVHGTFADRPWPGTDLLRDRVWNDRVGAAGRATERSRGEERREGRAGAFMRGEDQVLDRVNALRTKEMVVRIPTAAPRPHISRDKVLLLPDLLHITVHLVSNWHGRNQLVDRHRTFFGEVVRGRHPRAVGGRATSTATIEAALPGSMTREDILRALGHSTTSWRVLLEARGRTMGGGAIGRLELKRGDRIGRLCVEMGLGGDGRTENRRGTRLFNRVDMWVVRKDAVT